MKAFRKIFEQLPDNHVTCRKFYGGRITFVSKEHLNLLFFQKYEEKAWSRVQKLLKLEPSDEILDIGANIGQAMLILHHIFPKNKIYSFEPQFKEFSFLELNRQLNDIPGNNCHCLVAKEAKNYLLSVDDKTGGRITRISDFGSIQVHGKTLNSVITKNTKLIKVDIEGYEGELFSEYSETFNNLHFIIEVRKNTSKGIMETFSLTHKIIRLEDGIRLNVPAEIEFCNLLISPL